MVGYSEILIEMAGKIWTATPLKLGDLRRLLPKISEAFGATHEVLSISQIDLLVEIVSIALRDKHPELSRHSIEYEFLDVVNSRDVLSTVLEGSGLKTSQSSPRSDDDVWSSIYGLLATACGYSYPIIDEMTLFEFEELCSYWTEHPPVHLMVAAYLGVGDKGNREAASAGRRRSAPADEAFPLQLFGVPGLGPHRPFAVEFGPEAIGEIQSLWQRYEAAKAEG
jgi:hypothetical protein